MKESIFKKIWNYSITVDSVAIMWRQLMMRNEDLAADALDNAMKDQGPNWERKLYEFLRTKQAEKYLKR